MLLIVIPDFLVFIPPANFVCGGYTVFTLFVRACVCVCVRPSETFCFLNILKSHCLIFIKPCNHVHICKTNTLNKLEDLKVLRRSPDLINNVKIGQGQLQLIMEQILFYHIRGLQTFWSSDLNNLMNNPSNSPVISEKQMFR